MIASENTRMTAIIYYNTDTNTKVRGQQNLPLEVNSEYQDSDPQPIYSEELALHS